MGSAVKMKTLGVPFTALFDFCPRPLLTPLHRSSKKQQRDWDHSVCKMQDVCEMQERQDFGWNGPIHKSGEFDPGNFNSNFPYVFHLVKQAHWMDLKSWVASSWPQNETHWTLLTSATGILWQFGTDRIICAEPVRHPRSHVLGLQQTVPLFNQSVEVNVCFTLWARATTWKLGLLCFAQAWLYSMVPSFPLISKPRTIRTKTQKHSVFLHFKNIYIHTSTPLYFWTKHQFEWPL